MKCWNLVLVCMVCVVGCHDSRQTKDSNTNWLRGCGRAADCGSDQLCICGVCTVACVQDSACDVPEQPDAVCVELGQDSCEGASRGAVCLQRCARDSECNDDLACVDRTCQQSLSSVPKRDAGDDGAVDAAATGDASSDAATDAEAVQDAGPPRQLGETCSASLACGAGLSCEEGTCRSRFGAACEPAQSDRPACDENLACADGLVCHVDGTCIEPGKCDDSGRATLALVGAAVQLQSDATHLYWRDPGSEDALGNFQNDGAIRRMNLEDRAIETLVTGLPREAAMLISGDALYWIKGGALAGSLDELWTAPKSDSADATLLLSDEIQTWGHSPTYLYYTAVDGTLTRVHKELGGIGDVGGPGPAFGTILVDGTTLYFNGASRDIQSMPLAGTTASPVPDSAECMLVGLGRADIFCWSTSNGAGPLRSLPKNGGQSLNLALNAGTEPTLIMAYRDHLYFPNLLGDDPFGSTNNLTWHRAPRVPGDSELLSPVSVHPSETTYTMTVDDRGLFWTEGGRLFRIVIADYQMASIPAQGAAGGPCYGDLSCDGALSCVDTICE